MESTLSRACQAGVSAASDSDHQVQPGVDSPPTQSDSKTWELLLNDGNVVQYVNNSNIKDLLQDEERIRTKSGSNIEASSPQLQLPNITSAQTSSIQPGPSLGVSSGILQWYPEPQLALQLWAVYVKSVDPVLKILHIPTTQSAVISTILDPKSARSSMIALTFAIYYAATTALSHDNEAIELPLGQPVLLERCKTTLDKLLLSPEAMKRPEMALLQALAIYVTCLRVHETGRSVWILNGLAIRLAQSFGIHRDGACLRLSPFDTEMRLRLWWHLCVLDSRAPEDQGFELTLDVLHRGLRLPLNINDDQLFPSMTQLPVESAGWTEMSFFLIQTDSCRLLHPILGTREQSSAHALSDITAKRKMIKERINFMSSKYETTSSTASHLSRIAMQHLATACKKMEFMLQLREEISLQKQNDFQATESKTETLKPSFKLACDSMECNYILLNNEFSLGFKWLFTTYTPWYALAYVLRCLCNNPCGPNTKRAWALVEGVLPHELSLSGFSAETQGETGHGSIWKCLALLRRQTLLSRNAQRTVVGDDSNNDDNESLGAGHVESQGTELLSTHTVPNGTSLPELGIHEQDFIADSTQNIFSTWEFGDSGIPFLPEWNAVINGSLAEDDVLDFSRGIDEPGSLDESINMLTATMSKTAFSISSY
ncbi:hypothetical protein PENANT_c007G11380 [Penicillium antarcticum]|uniref:Xylanolytic transcriptional activator regulatory domain-containing protein n=1 Tax=Penicillium antarcticum TaxID=416450 RepID=A0A1V6QC24_9EURO|nr:hypothetical protein PENANT_c007G11380 [Penicillium antarcticum]